jgi:hypothetical protein
VAIALILIAAMQGLYARNYTVTNFSDYADEKDLTPGTLRYLIEHRAGPGDAISFANAGVIALKKSLWIDSTLKDITIQGPVTINGAGASGIYIASNRTTIQGMAFRSLSILFAEHVDRLKLLGNTFDDAGVGAMRVKLSDVTNSEVGRDANANSFIDVQLAIRTSSNITVANNIFTFKVPNQYGIDAATGNDISITSNAMSGCGIALVDVAGKANLNSIDNGGEVAVRAYNMGLSSGPLVILRNTITGGTTGIQVERTSVMVLGNSISDATRYGIHGTCARAGEDPNGGISISENNVRECGTGIYYYTMPTSDPTNPARISIIGNTVERNRAIGIYVDGAREQYMDISGRNLIIFNGTGKPGECGVFVNGKWKELSISDNTIFGNIGGGVIVQASTSKLEGVTAKGNNISGNNGTGMEVRGTKITAADNIVNSNGGDGMRFRSTAEGHILKGAARANSGAGIFVDQDASVQISQVEFGSNSGPGIDLSPDGVTDNASRKLGNNDIDWPEVTPDRLGNSIDKQGYIRGRSYPRCIVEAYEVESGPRTGNPRHGEGLHYLASATADDQGTFVIGPLSTQGNVTLTATTSDLRYTSEFSPDIGQPVFFWEVDTISLDRISYDSLIVVPGPWPKPGPKPNPDVDPDRKLYSLDIWHYWYWTHYRLYAPQGDTDHEDSTPELKPVWEVPPSTYIARIAPDPEAGARILLGDGSLYQARIDPETGTVMVTYQSRLDADLAGYFPYEKMVSDRTGLGDADIYQIAPESSGNYLCATSGGLFRRGPYDDGWTKIRSLEFTPVRRVFTDRQGAIYVDVGGRAVLRSNDRGASWDYAGPGLDSVSIEAFTDDAYGSIYAIADGGQRLYRLLKGKEVWERIGGRIQDELAYPNPIPLFQAIAGDSTLQVATSIGAYYSTDQGSTWYPRRTNAIAEDLAGYMALPSGRQIMTTDEGVFSRELRRTDWIRRIPEHGYLGGHHINLGSIFRDDVGRLYSLGLNQEPNGRLPRVAYKSTDAGSTWFADSSGNDLVAGDGLYYVDEGGTEHLASIDGASPAVYRRLPGEAWTYDMDGLNQLEPYSLSTAFASDRQGRIFLARNAGTGPLLWSHATGEAWAPDTAGLGEAVVTSLTCDRRGRMIAGTKWSGIFRRDGGIWKQLLLPELLRYSGVPTVAVDSLGTIYACFTHDDGRITTSQGVYASTDDGENWSCMGLDSIMVNTLVSYGVTTYALTDRGLYQYDGTSTSLQAFVEPMAHEVSFGDVEVGGAKDSVLVIYNSGNGPLSIDDVATTANGFKASVGVQIVPPGGSTEIRLRFTPLWSGDERGELIITGNAANSPISIPLHGRGVADAGIHQGEAGRGAVSLGESYPNPMIRNATIPFTLTRAAHVLLQVMDPLGNERLRLIDAEMEGGSHTVSLNLGDLDGARMPSGTYFYMLRAEGRALVKKFMIAR